MHCAPPSIHHRCPICMPHPSARATLRPAGGTPRAYVVSRQGTSSGFLWTAGQFFGIVILLVMGSLKEQEEEFFDEPANATNATNATSGDDSVEDMTHSMWMAVGCAGLATLILLPMGTPYRRLEAEATARTNELYKRDSSRSLTRPSVTIPGKGHMAQSLN